MSGLEMGFMIAKEFWYLILIAGAALIYHNFLKAKIKGYFGEKKVALMLKMLPKTEYKVLNNIMVTKEDGNTTQIDHIIVSIYGIFIVETKNYVGWIYGRETDKYWTQTIYKNKNKFQNPIHQNYGHVMTIKKLLEEYGDINIIPIIAFSAESTLKVNVTSRVGYIGNVTQYIKKEKEKLYSISEVEEFVLKIQNNNIMDRAERENHVTNIHRNLAEKEIEKQQKDICPQCGGKLVQKKSRYGYFKGCSNYPTCKYIAKQQKAEK